ncbi:RNA polymerase sigma-70 factor, ECF subfamily [bacterium A37T11]|nr:RNA polymerase sigma-70 factor, ECF subfamily [bacterium A37T11]
MSIRPHKDEAAILARVSNGDERAFSELFRWYSGPLAEFVQKLTDSLELTEEIVQDAFIKVWLRRDTLPQIEHFSNYLFILCRNHAFAILKKQAAQRVMQLEVEKYLQEDAELDELDNPAEHYRQLIDQAVTHLPEQQQKVYSLSRYDRLKHQEIAAQLHISPETVKKHIQLAVEFIKKEVENEYNKGIILILTSYFLYR